MEKYTERSAPREAESPVGGNNDREYVAAAVSATSHETLTFDDGWKNELNDTLAALYPLSPSLRRVLEDVPAYYKTEEGRLTYLKANGVRRLHDDLAEALEASHAAPYRTAAEGRAVGEDALRKAANLREKENAAFLTASGDLRANIAALADRLAARRHARAQTDELGVVLARMRDDMVTALEAAEEEEAASRTAFEELVTAKNREIEACGGDD
jgi:hypothetical protein